MDVISSFLQAEINSQELYEDIINFITSFHVRNGEFEGNEYIIKKMDQLNFLIFSEYVLQDGKREIHSATSVYRHNLLKEIKNYAPTKGIKIINTDC